MRAQVQKHVDTHTFTHTQHKRERARERERMRARERASERSKAVVVGQGSDMSDLVRVAERRARPAEFAVGVLFLAPPVRDRHLAERAGRHWILVFGLTVTLLVVLISLRRVGLLLRDRVEHLAENALLVLHVLGGFLLVVPLVLAPRGRLAAASNELVSARQVLGLEAAHHRREMYLLAVRGLQKIGGEIPGSTPEKLLDGERAMADNAVRLGVLGYLRHGGCDVFAAVQPLDAHVFEAHVPSLQALVQTRHLRRVRALVCHVLRHRPSFLERPVPALGPLTIELHAVSQPLAGALCRRAKTQT